MTITNDRATQEFSVLGTRPIRQDGVDKVTGRAIYGADARAGGMLHAKVLRSPHAHARILSIDLSRAAALPGVHAIVTAADLPEIDARKRIEENETGMQSLRYKSANLLARDKVLYHGHAIAAVAAVDAITAEEATRLIDVRYEVLPPVMDVRQAMEPDAPLLLDDLFTDTGGKRASTPSNIAMHWIFAEGDLDRGFAEADHVFEREFTTATVHQGYIEPQNALAYWSPDGALTLECSSQGQFWIRDEMSKLLEWPISKVRVIPLEIGGGFGGKTTSYLGPLAALLSRKSGRPVKMTMDRSEILIGSGPTSGSYMRVKLGVTRDGRITAAQAFLAYEAGAFPGSPVTGGAVGAFGPYNVSSFRVDAFDVVVNKPKTHAYRAPGTPQSAFAVETLVDEVCERLGLDKIEFRLANAAREGDIRADGTRYQRIGMVECLEAARASDHWRSPLLAPDAPRKKRGRGIASGVWKNAGGRSSVLARLDPDGSVTLLHGSVDIGGTRTSLAMQLAETLGITVDDVRSIVLDTDAISYNDVTGGSRTTNVSGHAAHMAGQDLQRQVRQKLAELWGVSPEDVVIDGAAFVCGSRRVTLREAAKQLTGAGMQLVGSADLFQSHFQGVGPSFAVHLADVEVDEETGAVKVLRYTAVQDAGKAVYPPYVEGQMQGGVLQGVGWALNEEYVYGADGRMRNQSLLDYRMPTALDLPMIETVLVEVPNPGHPYGVRGVGEVPIVPPLATVANAIAHATGIRQPKLPASPRAIIEAKLAQDEAQA